MASKYIIAVRTIFTFTTDDVNLAKILTQNVALDAVIDVNIVSQSFDRASDDLISAKLIVGTDDPNDESNKFQNERFRFILNTNCIKFKERPIIQISNIEAAAGTPGSFRIPYTALLCNDIKILSVLVGEPAPGHVISTFFEVPIQQTRKATHILRNFDSANPETQLCINRENV